MPDKNTIAQEILNAKYISFGTYRKNGANVSTPVWAGHFDDALYVFSEATAGKVKRLRNFSKSTIAPCTFKGKVTGAHYASEAALLTSDHDIKIAYKALYKKYGLLMGITDLMSRVSGRYHKRTLIRIEPGKQLDGVA